MSVIDGVDDEQDERARAEHIADALKVCRCCRCAQPPCEGTLAGGLCDELCWCGDDDAGDDAMDEPGVCTRCLEEPCACAWADDDEAFGGF